MGTVGAQLVQGKVPVVQRWLVVRGFNETLTAKLDRGLVERCIAYTTQRQICGVLKWGCTALRA